MKKRRKKSSYYNCGGMMKYNTGGSIARILGTLGGLALAVPTGGLSIPAGLALGSTVGNLAGSEIDKIKGKESSQNTLPQVPQGIINTNPLGDEFLKSGGWISKVSAGIKKRGTKGVCTGSKFGSSSCLPGSKRYTLAKTFKKMARNREDGGKVIEEAIENENNPESGVYNRLYSFDRPLRSMNNGNLGRAISNEETEAYNRGNIGKNGQLLDRYLRLLSPEEINKFYHGERFSQEFYNNSRKDGGNIMKYSGPTHNQGGIMVNSLGIPVNNPNNAVAEVEGGESKLDNYIFSNSLGLNKNKQVELNPNKVKRTFSSLTKSVDSRLGKRSDEISKYSKSLMYSLIKDKNQEAIMKKGGKIPSMYYFEGGEDPYTLATNMYNQSAASNPYNPYLSYVDPTTSDENIIDNYSKFQNNILGRNIVGTGSTNKAESAIENPTQGGGMEDKFNFNNALDYISPAFNTIAAGISLFNKNKNYLERPDYSTLNYLEQLPVNPDYTQLYNRNQRTFNAANQLSKSYNPSISGVLRSNNLAQKLNADNEIAFTANREKMDRLSNKLQMLAGEKARLNQYRESSLHTFRNENNMDKQAREEGSLGYLSQAVNDIQKIRNDKQLLKILPQALRYYTYDSKTNTYTLKPGVGNIFNLPLTLDATKE